ncbi:MAG: HAMP domain-containing sensor histidine kinase [Agathobacter sp.]|nr:HAMP domain-containing sensor histidine kinase [Agathobacter sp.]
MAVKKTKTLKSIFSIFLIKTILGLVMSILIPVLLFWFFVNIGSISYANSSEIEVLSIADSLKSVEKPQLVLSKLSGRIKYLLLDYANNILETTMDEKEAEEALYFFKVGTVSQNRQIRYVTVERNEEVILLQYKVGSFFVNNRLDKILPSPEVILVIVIIFGGFVSSFFQIIYLERRIRKELNPIFDATKEFAKQNLNYEVKHSDIKEIEEVLMSFAHMKDELGDSLKRQWELQQEQKEQIAALVHDIKTPMTVTIGNLDLLEETTLTQEQSRLVASAFEGLDKISRYIQFLMDITMASVKYQYCFIDFSFRNFIEIIQKQAFILCQNRGIEFISEIAILTESCFGDVNMLERAVMNVIQNAVEHTPDGGKLFLKSYVQDSLMWLQVEDTGSGFSSKMLQQGGKLFAMDDVSRTTGYHYGMGLYFADSVIRTHGGEMILENSRETGGAKITIKIKLKK